MTARIAQMIAALAVLVTGPAFAASAGQTLFETNCSACHRPTGQGVPGAFPALAGNPFVQGDRDKVIATVLGGRGGMPVFGNDIGDADLAAILSYVRTSWGNAASLVSPDAVAAVRSQTGAQSADAGLQAH
jgi:mono/diheme cytochrome c family protein